VPGDFIVAKNIRITIEGDEKLLKKLRALGAGVEQVLESAVLAGAEIVKDQANSLAPGPHIETEVTEKSRTKATAEIGPDKDYWYYRFFETGTSSHEVTPKNAGGLQFMGPGGEMIVRMITHPSGMAANPFLRPAMDEKKDTVVDATGSEFKREIDKQVEK
jgi:HK97 gp10 family phage protein